MISRRIRRGIQWVGGLLFVTLMPVAGRGAAARPSACAPAGQQAEVKAIEKRIGGLRSLSDDRRGPATYQLAIEIRGVHDPASRLAMAELLANLSTEGDFGHETLQAVTDTLANALRTDPDPSAAAPDPNGTSMADFAIVTLAQLVRYERTVVSPESPSLRKELRLLAEQDRQRDAADFTLNDLNGDPWRLKSLGGKVVLVNFWATWCPPCRKEIPDLEALYNRFKNKGLVVLGISDEAASTVRAFVASHNMTYPVLLDPGRKVEQQFVVQGIPKTFVYSRKGKLAAEAIDMRTRDQLLALLASAGMR
ncbi:MAG TPA: TlpA disulfide reductase family protein [Chthonomonadales bacterium]|nr:TlpA disulfide reductase family protein [Chthonomonadales bacterium]